MIEDGENGYLVPVFDDGLMKEKLEYLMDHEEERQKMGENARRSMTTNEDKGQKVLLIALFKNRDLM